MLQLVESLGYLSTNAASNAEEVHAFEKELCKIADMDTGEVEDKDLLKAMPFSCCTNAKSVVNSVWRHQE